jgi:hypothetical protein
MRGISPGSAAPCFAKSAFRRGSAFSKRSAPTASAKACLSDIVLTFGCRGASQGLDLELNILGIAAKRKMYARMKPESLGVDLDAHRRC